MAIASSIVDKVADFLADIVYVFGKHGLMSEVESYGQLNTAVPLNIFPTFIPEGEPDTLITKEGSVITMFALKGTSRMLSDDMENYELRSFYSKLANALLPYYKKGGQHVEIVFERDPDRVHQELTELLAPAVRSLKNHNMPLEMMMRGKVKANAKFCAAERIWIAFYSHMSVLNEGERKAEVEEMNRRAKEAKFSNRELGAVECWKVSELLLEHHKTEAKNFFDSLRSRGGLLMVPVAAKDACRESKRALDPAGTGPNWSPIVPGDAIMPVDTRSGDVAIMPQRLSQQMVPSTVTTKGEMVTIGDRYYGTGHVTRGPRSIESFARLFREIDRTIPWRLSFSIYPKGMDFHKVSKGVSAVLGFFGGHLKQINESFGFLKKCAEKENVPTGLRVVFQTWGKSDFEVRRRLQIINHQIQSWGGMHTSSVFGDAMLGLLAGIPAYSNYNGAHTLVPPISEAVKLLPVVRPASPWDRGTMLFRTGDGKPFPYMHGSDLQATWVEFYISPPGSGKSSTMNSMNFAFVTMPGQTEIPYLCCLDIGESSFGLIESIQDSLPPGQKHYAFFKRLQNDARDAMNFLDTQPGCRFPNQEERQHALGMFLAFCTPNGKLSPYDGADDLGQKLMELAYKKFSPEQSPKLYRPMIDLEVDAALEGVQLEDQPTWWEVVDALWLKGDLHASMLAQRHAVPVLNDLVSLINSREIREIFAKEGREVRVQATSELLIDAVARQLSTAVNDYPAFANTTTLDIGEARLIALDLQDVCPKGDAVAAKKAGLFMLAARFLFAKKVFINKDTVRTWLPNCPAIYHDYHIKRASTLDKVMKAMACDEIHRGVKLPAVLDTWVLDCREGRKWNLRMAFSTQYLNDIPDVLLDANTAVFAMKYQNAKVNADLKTRVGFSDIALERFAKECNGPVNGVGAPMLAMFNTTLGQVEQIIWNTQSPEEAWALSTTSQDRWLRKDLVQRVGMLRTLSALSTLFPTGSCRGEYVRRLNRMTGEVKTRSDEELETVNPDILQEMSNEAYERIVKSNERSARELEPA